MKGSISRSWIAYLLPAMILLAGVVLRIYPTLTIPFWEDELHTYHFSTNETTYLQQLLKPQDDRPPLLYFFTKILVKFGSSEFFLRFPGFFASCLALYIAYIYVKKKHEISGLILLFLMTFSLFLIDQAWQFRDYGFLTLVTALTLICLYTIIEKLSKNEQLLRRDLVNIGLIAIIGTMTNYIYIPFIFSIGISLSILLVFLKYSRPIYTILSLIAALSPSIFLSGIYLIRQTEIIMRTTYFIQHPTFTSFVALGSYTYGLISNFTDFPVRELILEQQYFYSAFAVIGGILILYITLWNHKKSPLYIFSLCCYSIFFFYILSIQGISYILHRSLFLPKTFTPAVIAAIFSISTLVGLFIETCIVRSYRSSVLAILGLLYLCIFTNLYTSFYKIGTFKGDQPIRDTNNFLNFIKTETSQNDQFVFLPMYYADIYPSYFWRHTKFHEQLSLSKYVQHSVDAKSIDITPPTMKENGRIFFIINPKIFNPEYKMFDASFVTYTKTIYMRAQRFCADTPSDAFANELFIIRMCMYKAVR